MSCHNFIFAAMNSCIVSPISQYFCMRPDEHHSTWRNSGFLLTACSECDAECARIGSRKEEILTAYVAHNPRFSRTEFLEQANLMTDSAGFVNLNLLMMARYLEWAAAGHDGPPDVLFSVSSACTAIARATGREGPCDSCP